MELFVIFVLILLNAWFAMFEAAIVSARKSRLKQDIEKGDKNALITLKFAEDPDKLLSATQTGITFISIIIGIHAGMTLAPNVESYIKSNFPALLDYSFSVSLICTVLIITIFMITFGELIPKKIGVIYSESIAKLFIHPIYIFSKVVYPIIWLITKTGNLFLKLFGIKDAPDTAITEEEIKAIVFESKEAGTIDEMEQEMVERVFHLGDRNVLSLMTHRSEIVWLDINDTVEEIMKSIREAPFSTYLVCNGDIDDILGVVYTKELFISDISKGLKPFIHKPLLIPDNNTAYEVLGKFKTSKIHLGFIVDEFGVLQGMVTLKDILEALIGEMPDTNEEVFEIIDRGDHSYLIDAQMPLFQFFEYFEIKDYKNYIEEDYNTLAGFILSHFGRIPETGEKFTWREYEIEVIDLDKNRIDKVLVTEISANQESQKF